MTEIQKKSLKARTDVAQCFLTYMALVGDVPKVATALDLDPDFVQWLAETEGWLEKIRRVSTMAKSGREGDFERSLNRAMIFTQAHQMRGLLDKVIREVRDLSSAELCERCSTYDRLGKNHISAKFFTDMAQAIETTARVSLVALSDTVTERVERDDAKEGGNLSVSALHQAIVAALSSPVLESKVVEDLIREQTGHVRLLADKVSAPETPA